MTVHVIGDGEKCPQLLQALKDAGAEVDWRGVVYDEAEKHAVMSCCHFGFNLMKPDVCVGLTMKSVDYFRHDLPILNNIPADTAELVDREPGGRQRGTGYSGPGGRNDGGGLPAHAGECPPGV